MALRCEVIYFVRFHFEHNLDNARSISHIAPVQRDLIRIGQVTDALRRIHRRTANHAVHLIALFQQKLCQIAAVLPGNSCNQCFFHKKSSIMLSQPANKRLKFFAYARKL